MDKVMDVYPQLVAESAKEGFITDKVWYDTGLVDIFEPARQQYNETDKKERPMTNLPEKWIKPQSREHRTLIQRDFEHLSHPNRVAERKKYYDDLRHEENMKAEQQNTSITRQGRINRKNKRCTNVMCPSEMLCVGVPKDWLGCEKCTKNIFSCDKCLASEDPYEKHFKETVEEHLLVCEGEEQDKKKKK